MMDIDQILDVLRQACQPVELAVEHRLVDETFVTLPPAYLCPVVHLLIERFGIYHLSTITGQDLDGQIELLYHFWGGRGLTLCVRVPRSEARVPTLTGLIAGATFYEREVSEMLHVDFEGHPDLQPLLLADDWTGDAVLRREFSLPPENEQEER
jgi:NADH:ubiquinone oxidoreductase subunit C